MPDERPPAADLLLWKVFGLTPAEQRELSAPHAEWLRAAACSLPDDRSRPNPISLGDPRWGTLTCRVCGGVIHADEPYRRVVRFWMLPGRGGWRRAFAHTMHPEAQSA